MRKRYLLCHQCETIVRVDDNSYTTPSGQECDHFFDQPKTTESTLVVFRSPDGKVSIPWEPNAPCPPGYTKEEIKGAHASRKLEKELDAADRKRYEQYQLKVERLKGPSRERRRQDLHQIIRDGVTVVPDGRGGQRTIHVSEFGKAIARQALEKMQSGYSKSYDPGNFRES